MWERVGEITGIGAILGSLLIAGSAVGHADDMPQAKDIGLAYIGQQVIPHQYRYQETVVGGLSALEYNAETDRYVAICDDRSDKNAARFYELSLTFDESGFHKWALKDRHYMRRPDGSLFPKASLMGKTTVDPEALKLAPGGESYFWTSEGHAKHRVNPFIREMSLKGDYIRDFTVPEKYLLNDAGRKGVRDNLAFEALTVNHNRTSFTVATEGPLVQDGPEATAKQGAPVRFLTLDIASGQARYEYVYPVSPVHKESLPFGNFSVNGVVDILAVSEHHYIVAERSFSTGAGLTVKLYLADFTGATDVLSKDSLAGLEYQAAKKTLLLDLGGLGVAIDNIEGMTFGKPLADGRRTLLLISDDNFRSAQISQILAFVVEER